MLKKISIVFLFVVMLLSIGGVCASDAPDLDYAGDDNLGTIYTSNVSGVGTEKSFTDIQNLIGTEVTEDKVVNLSGVYTGNNSISFKIKNGATLIINGEEGTVLDGQSLTRIFLIEESNGTLVLNNLKLTNSNGHDNAGGGAIYSENVNLFLNDCIFYNHTSTDNVGGAVVAYGDCQVNVKNCIFENCTALGGGALCIYDENSTLTVNKSTFRNNVATDNSTIPGRKYYSGGAILSKAQLIEITDSTFENNKAPLTLGGAISVGFSEEYIDFTVIACTFYNNSANNGGAIYAKNLYLKDSSFELNHVDAVPEESMSHGGGAITGFTGIELKAENSSFISNYVDGRKVTILSVGGGAIDGSFIELNNCYFEGNYVISENSTETSLGGAISAGNNITVRDSTFIANHCTGDGGAIYCTSNIIIYSSTFINNTATNDGGAIISKTQIYIDNSSFINNLAFNKGGAILMDVYYLDQYKQVVKNSIFVANSANKGDAIYLDSSDGKTMYLYNFECDDCYWGHNHLTKESFINSGLITINNTNLAPHEWILMNMTKISQKDNIKLYKLTLNTITNGEIIANGYVYLPDYTVDLVSALGNEIIPSEVTIINGEALFVLVKNIEGKDIINVYDPNSSQLLLSSEDLPDKPNNNGTGNNNSNSLPNAGNPLLLLILSLISIPLIRIKK